MPETFSIDATRTLIGADTLNGLGVVENRHAAWLVLCDWPARQYIATAGALAQSTFIRSACKPFQALPLVELGGADALSETELVLTCASHTGSECHIQKVSRILGKAGLPESALQCGPHLPLDAAMQTALQALGDMPQAIHNNCSGKHAGMLFCCVKQGWEIHHYLSPDHPLQRQIMDRIRHLTGLPDIPLAKDGCGAPVPYLPLSAMAGLYAQLAVLPVFKPLTDAMTRHPYLVGGHGRIDTCIMQARPGELLAKVGADGVICLAHMGKQQGLAMKIADGSQFVRDMAIVEVLLCLGWLHPDDIALSSGLQAFQNAGKRMNTQNKSIGRYCVNFESDECIKTPF